MRCRGLAVKHRMHGLFRHNASFNEAAHCWAEGGLQGGGQAGQVVSSMRPPVSRRMRRGSTGNKNAAYFGFNEAGHRCPEAPGNIIMTQTERSEYGVI